MQRYSDKNFRLIVKKEMHLLCIMYNIYAKLSLSKTIVSSPKKVMHHCLDTQQYNAQSVLNIFVQFKFF